MMTEAKRCRLYELDGELIAADIDLTANFSGIHELVGSGSKFWRLNGMRHRDNDLPSCEFSNGAKHWYVNGQMHRINGPALIDSFGNKKWFLFDIECTQESHSLLVDMMKLKGLI